MMPAFPEQTVARRDNMVFCASNSSEVQCERWSPSERTHVCGECPTCIFILYPTFFNCCRGVERSDSSWSMARTLASRVREIVWKVSLLCFLYCDTKSFKSTGSPTLITAFLRPQNFLLPNVSRSRSPTISRSRSVVIWSSSYCWSRAIKLIAVSRPLRSAFALLRNASAGFWTRSFSSS